MQWHVRPASVELRGDGSTQLGNGVNVVGYFKGKSEMYSSYMRAANEMRMIGFRDEIGHIPLSLDPP